MRIPLPAAESLTGDVADVYNALTNQALNQHKMRLENEYYAPNMQSQISNRNALTEGYNIANENAPIKNELVNDQLSLSNQYNREHNPLAIQKEKTLLNYLPQSEQARIKSLNAIAELRQQGGASGMGVDQKAAMGFKNQLAIDNPNSTPEQINEMANSYYEGLNTLKDGTPLPPLSGQAQDKLTKIQKRNSTAGIQNQTANMDVLAKDLNELDISPLMAFSGPKGKIRYGQEATAMALGKPVSQEFRDYQSFKNIVSNFNMDALRKAFGTSVVPGYVYATLGNASNPNSKWWYDPQQVANDWKKTLDWINKNAESLKKKSKYGATANINENTQSNGNQVKSKSTSSVMTYNPSTGRLE